MRKRSRKWSRAFLAAALLLTLPGVALAQSQSGNLYGTVTDTGGEILPGVTVTVMIAGGGVERLQVTGETGEFRFIGLPPATYDLKAMLDGFSTVEYPSIQISVNRNTTLIVEMAPAVSETITVTSESPLLDTRKIATGTTVSQVELEKIPSARDPWAVLQTIPGVQTDRINVGGNESGQQSAYTGPGSNDTDSVWSVDGVVITDMAAVGSSPTYYNFDAFEEIQATTGGSDASVATGGVILNMVTRRGTNEWRGSGRYNYAQDGWQSGLNLDPSDLGPGQDAFSQGNRIVSVKEYGAEVGGPIVRDKLWIWANYGKNEIDLLTIDDVSDFTDLEDYGAKVNAQLSAKNSGVLFYNFGNKVKIGRNAGPSRPQPTTWNQDGPTSVYKLEDTHVFSSSFYLTGMLSYVDGPFTLTPQAGIDGPAIILDSEFVWQANFFHHDTSRPQDQTKLDGSYFFNTGEVSHELKFGVGYRRTDLESQSLWAGNGVRLDFYIPNYGYDYNIFEVARTTANDSETTYENLYAQDTLTVGDLTLNVGLRYDKQEGKVNSASVPGVPGFETLPDGTPLLPAATSPAFDQGFDWTNLTPRLGLTWALGSERKTLLRASYSRFAEQLRNGYTSYAAPLAPGNYSYAYFYYEDTNGDGFVTVDEIIDFADGPLFDNGYDPLGQQSVNRIDPGFDAPVTDELILSLEHAVRPEFLLGAVVTLRNRSKIAEFERLVIDETGLLRPHQRSDYVQYDDPTIVERPDGTTYEVPLYQFREELTDTGGFYLTNGDREQNYMGLSLVFNKRLTNRWMLRGNLTLQDWEWDIPQSELEDPNVYLGGAEIDGGAVIQGSGTASGSKGAVYINAGWSYSVTGLYQVAPERPWGFNLSAALYGREGYPIPYFLYSSGAFTSGAAFLQATEQADQYSNDDIHQVDLRLEKEFSLKDTNFTFGVELFNAFNEASVLQRKHQLEVGTTGDVLEVVSPRIFRLSVRFQFK